MAKYQNSSDLIESCFSDIQNVGEIHAAQKNNQTKPIFFFFFLSRRLRLQHMLLRQVVHVFFPDLNIQLYDTIHTS